MTPTSLRNYPYYDSHEEEKPARQRRTRLFAEASGLTPRRITVADRLYQRLRHHVHTDHPTPWVSRVGTSMILVETYQALDLKALAKQGFVSIEIAPPLAPYCGGWNAAWGAQPLTRSYLTCSAQHRAELHSIASALMVASLSAPAWNFTEGVQP
jgi:hypothetical protein